MWMKSISWLHVTATIEVYVSYLKAEQNQQGKIKVFKPLGSYIIRNLPCALKGVPSRDG